MLSTKQRWVCNWLKRRGYKLYNSHEDFEWWALEIDPCALIVEIGPRGHSAKFRPLRQASIHVTRYFRPLNTEAGRNELRDFEVIYERLKWSICGASPDSPCAEETSNSCSTEG